MDHNSTIRTNGTEWGGGCGKHAAEKKKYTNLYTVKLIRLKQGMDE